MKNIHKLAVVLFLIFPTLSWAQQWKIMPVGNSLTAGKDGNTQIEGNGYRKYLFDDLKTSGVDMSFVGSRGNSPYNGHFVSGAKIDWFLSGGSMDIKTALDLYQPDIVLLHAGTNNTGDIQGPYTQQYTASYNLRKLINESIAKDPNVQYILLCKIAPKLDDNFQEIAAIKQLNKEIEAMFFNNALSSKVVLVDMYSALSPTRSDLPDKIHPTDAGYKKMADEYARVIKAVIKTDTAAPSAVDVIAATATGEPAIKLEWFTPTDTGGIPNLYELRYKIDEDLTAANFETGQVAYLNRPGRNAVSGGKEQRTITEGILSGRTYSFAIRVYDQANNKSAIRKFDPVTMPDQLAQAGIAHADSFNYSDLRGWKAASSYVVANGNLRNTDATSAWKKLAVLDSIKYTPSAEYVKVSARFAMVNTYSDLKGTGIAMLLDTNEYGLATGYMIRVGDNIDLYTIDKGQVLGSAISSNKPLTGLQRGDTLSVVYRNNPTANSFEVLKNGTSIGTVQDAQKRYGNAEVLYSGIMLYGSLKNEIDSYSISIPQLQADRMLVFGEPPTSGEVDKKLSNPLSVQVVDINGVGVGNVPVDFRVKSGDAFLSADSVCQNFDGYLYIEAESGIAEAPMVSAKDDKASNSRYIYTKTYGKGKSIYTFWAPCTGSYDLILRVLAPDDNSNSIFWAIDDTTSINSNSARMDFVDKPTVWTWANRSRVGNIPLSEGFHRFYLKGREKNTRIDKILITRHSGFVPTNEGGATTKLPNITDGRGIVSTNVTFGTQAGEVVIDAFSDAVPPPDNSVEFPPITVNAGTPATFTADTLIIRGEAGKLLRQPFQVQIEDRYGNKRRGEQVIFQVLEGDGSFNGSSVEKAFTDEDGVAQATLRLGYNPQTTVEAKINDYPDMAPITFTGAAETGTIPFTVERITTAEHFEAPVTTRLPDSLKVQVLNQKGDPYRGYPVPFTIIKGDGKLNGSATTLVDTTDALGTAAVSWTLGKKAGVDSHRVEVKIPLNGSPLLFTATALPDAPNELQLTSGNEQTQGAGKKFAEPLRVRIVDQYSNGIVNFKVRYTVASGYGNFSGKLIGGTTDTTVVTDAKGYAQVFYMAGNVPGTEQVKAAGAESQPLPQPTNHYVIFQPLTVTKPLPQKLVIDSGNNQGKSVGSILDPFAVKIKDPFDKVMGANIKVHFQVNEGNSSFSNSPDGVDVFTDASGIARASMTLGHIAGIHKARVTLPDYPDVLPVEFTATAVAGAAAKLAAAQPVNFSGVAGSGPIPLSVQVTDIYGNARSGQSVTFSVEQGGYFQTAGGNLKSTQSSSDVKGLATVNYFMGTQTSETNIIKIQSFQSGSTHLQGSPITFTGTVLAGLPVTLLKIKNYSQTVPIQSTYPDSIIVQLKDVHQNPVPDIDVQFTVQNHYGGNIAGETQATIFTNRKGQAGVRYTMGTKAASQSDTVVVSAPGYSSLQPVKILLTAKAADPQKIKVIGDSTWTLKLGSPLAKTPTVKVTDAYNNAISGQPVTFTVTKGNSTVNGAQSYAATTQSNGEASVPWLFNSTSPEQHTLTASAEFNGKALQSSPHTFSAVIGTGDASQLVRVSPGPQSNAIANNNMVLTVKVQDANQNGIANNTVKFKVSNPASGSGYFVDNGQPVFVYQTTTDEQGFAQATFRPVIGSNIVTVNAADNQPITGLSFVINGLAAKAASIHLVNSRNMELSAGGSVTVKMEAYDAQGAMVDGHPIEFRIVGKEGNLSNGYNVSSKGTVNGIAEEVWTVGKDVNVINKLRISGGDGIPGSPDSIIVKIKPSAPFADSSRVLITATGGVIITDDNSKAIVTVKLADTFGNPVSGYRVRLASEHAAAILEQPASETNTKGEAYGFVRATKVGKISVYAVLESDPNFRIRGAQVIVKAGKPAKLALPSGASDRFTGNVGAVLMNPLQVEVKDKYDNTVQPFTAEVQFEIKSGNGEFITSTGRVKKTNIQVDSTGLASVVVKMGSSVESYLLEATLSDPPNTGAKLTFIGNSRNSVPYTLKKVSGDSASLTVGVLSQKPLVVRVTDKDGLPVWSGTMPTVVFTTTTTGQIDYSGSNNAASDEYGHAAKYFKLLNGGKHTIEAKIFGGESPVFFTVFAKAGAPDKLIAAVAPSQKATVASAQNNLIKVQVTDKDGNAVNDVPVKFQIQEEPEQTNGAVVDESPVLTGSGGEAGIATAKITLGEKAGEYVIRATTPRLTGKQVDFTIDAQAEAAYYIGKHSGDRQSMTRGRALVYPVVVKVTDKFQNPVANVTVTFAPKDNVSGSVAFLSVPTDNSGLAENIWTIGSADFKLYFQKLGLKPWPSGSDLFFEAYGVDNHFPEFIGMKSDTTIVYGQPFTLKLNARDEDSEPLRYSMPVKPSSAVFDAANGKMTWTPTRNEIGTWTAKFRVDDNQPFSGFDVDSIRINVISKIYIINYSPEALNLKIPENGAQEFSVSVTDQNPNHNVVYSWFVDGVMQPATGSRFILDARNFAKPSYKVKVVVNDGVSQAEHSWDIKVKVELSSFEAKTVPFVGVSLDWKTSTEDGNLGFDVLRSLSKNGEYCKINDGLIQSRSDGAYSYSDTTAAAGRAYFYKLEDFDRGGLRTQSEELMVTVDIPKDFMLLQNYPNPFNPKTAIRFQLPKTVLTRVAIFNIRGQLVKTLVNERLEPGYHEATWNGLNEENMQTGSGIYYYRIQAGDFNATKKMVMIR